MSVGKQVRLFLVDGTPGGLLTAEIMNWTGHVIAAPRSDIAELLKRSEARRTGIYVLLGDDPDTGGGLCAYIGEGDDISARLRQHARSAEQGGKDFWDRVIILTSKDANPTKAHSRYLESRLIDLATQAKRARLVNGTAPAPIQLPEADVSDMEYFISQAVIVLPVLGVTLLRSVGMKSVPRVDHAPQPIEASPVFSISLAKAGITARAREIDGEFTVLQSSGARPTWVGTRHGYSGLHAKLIGDGSIDVTPSGQATFTRDVAFASPSAAGAVITGRACNGRTAWLSTEAGETFGHWQSRGLGDGQPLDA